MGTVPLALSDSVRARRVQLEHLPPSPVLPVQMGKGDSKRGREPHNTGCFTFEEDKSSISPFVGRIDAGGQAFPELLDLHGVALLHTVIAQAPEPAILGIKEAGRERVITGSVSQPSHLSSGVQA